MFRVLFAPIIRSALKLYMQLLVQSCVGVVSDPQHCTLAKLGLSPNLASVQCCTIPTPDHLLTDRI